MRPMPPAMTSLAVKRRASSGNMATVPVQRVWWLARYAGAGGAPVEHPDVVQAQEPPWNTLRPSTSFRFNHQTKFLIIFWSVPGAVTGTR